MWKTKANKMLVENSIVVANFIKGLFVPMEVLAVAAFILAYIIAAAAYINEKKKLLYWEIPLGIFLMFAVWFFSTFELR